MYSCNERLPNTEDADVNGDVLWLRSGTWVLGRVHRGKPVDATHWRKVGMAIYSIVYPIYNAEGEFLTNQTEYYDEDRILNEYFYYWSEEMKKVGLSDKISKERCIEDWITVNWATKETLL